MTKPVLPPLQTTTLAVAGSGERFPVGRVWCIGRNYRWSAGEARPEHPPSWFLKPADAIVDAEGVLPYPPGSDDFCHEIELVVAIARGGRDIPAEAVLDGHVWGYAAGLDLTRRDLQHAAKRVGGPWTPAKVFDACAPCTPLLPVASIGHPRRGAIWLAVDGVERQRADIAELLWPVAELVAMLSRSVTLRPGDLVFTGTPAGVGPLQPGDVVTAGVDAIGALRMTVGPRPQDSLKGDSL